MTVQFSVVEKPVELTSSLQDVTITQLHSTAEFRLQVSKPDCKITWLKASSPIIQGPKYTIGMDDLQPYLKVNDVTGSDEGVYSVTVDDKKSTAKLVVQGTCDLSISSLCSIASNTCTDNSHLLLLVAPKIGEVRKELVLKTGQTLELAVPYEAFPEAKAELLFENKPLSQAIPHSVSVNEDTCTVKISKLSRPEQCGTVTVKLENPYGVDSVDVSLTITGRSPTLKDHQLEILKIHI